MGTLSAIAIELEGIGRILLNRNLAVPIYQRSYAWEEEHVSDLINDVETSRAESAHEYFIGSLVTTRNQAARAEVADGQQRLATITIERAQVKAALRNIVSWSVRFLTHGGLGSGAIETHNCAAAREVREKRISTAPQLFKRLKGVLPNDAQFRASFTAATVSKAYLARYYLRALEQQERGDAEPELVPNPNTEIVNLEHVLPQNPSSSWSHISPDEQVLLLKRLGNLVLMKTNINTKAGNDSFAFKKEFYRVSEFKLTNTLQVKTVWDRTGIEKRQAHLADLAVKTW